MDRFQIKSGDWLNIGVLSYPYMKSHRGDKTIFTTWAVDRFQIKSGDWLNIGLLSYPYMKSHRGDKTILRSSYFHNEISYTGQTTLFIEPGPWFYCLERRCLCKQCIPTSIRATFVNTPHTEHTLSFVLPHSLGHSGLVLLENLNGNIC